MNMKAEVNVRCPTQLLSIFLKLCICVGYVHISAGGLGGQKRFRDFRAGITGICDLPNVGGVN